MKFLVDQQLPVALARALRDRRVDCEHVFEKRLDQATDVEIWRYAISQDRVVISKDEDFVLLAKASPESGKLIWVRLGNCRNESLLAVFQEQLDGMINALNDKNNIVELR